MSKSHPNQFRMEIAGRILPGRGEMERFVDERRLDGITGSASIVNPPSRQTLRYPMGTRDE